MLRSPEDGELITKRVIGKGDDWLFARDGRLVKCPKRHVWVEGDNASNSHDSNHYGAVPHCLLVGNVRAKLWPVPAGVPSRRGERHTHKYNDEQHLHATPHQPLPCHAGECEARVLPERALRRHNSQVELEGAGRSGLLRALTAAREATREYTQPSS